MALSAPGAFRQHMFGRSCTTWPCSGDAGSVVSSVSHDDERAPCGGAGLDVRTSLPYQHEHGCSPVFAAGPICQVGARHIPRPWEHEQTMLGDSCSTRQGRDRSGSPRASEAPLAFRFCGARYSWSDRSLRAAPSPTSGSPSVFPLRPALVSAGMSTADSRPRWHHIHARWRLPGVTASLLSPRQKEAQGARRSRESAH